MHLLQNNIQLFLFDPVQLHSVQSFHLTQVTEYNITWAKTEENKYYNI